jgi:hypothetical protein
MSIDIESLAARLEHDAERWLTSPRTLHGRADLKNAAKGLRALAERDAEIERLRELVESSFHEGHVMGYRSAAGGIVIGWQHSDSRVALTPPEEPAND